jgi:hypothetical protein
MSERVALYLQDAHDLRDGFEYVQYAEKRGFAWCGMLLFQWQHMPP